MGKKTKVPSSREKDGVVWSKLKPQHPSSIFTHCSLKRACLSLNCTPQLMGKMGKRPKSMAQGRRMEKYSQNSYLNIPPVYLHTPSLRGHS
jgi:hypothetical protein